MNIKRLSKIMVVAAMLITLAITACGGKKTAPSKPDNEPGLRQNKAEMMNRVDSATSRK
jgi:predicted small lipoprotein YifL